MHMTKPENFSMYDRSQRFAQVVEARGVGSIRLAVTVDQEIVGTQMAQVLALAICNIVPRMSERYTHIDLCIPPQLVAIPRVNWRGSLSEYLLAELKAICPWGSFRAVDSLAEVYDHCIVIGRTTPLAAKHIVHVLASGWRCFVSEVGPSAWPAMAFNPCSCLAAAALASMFVYRHAEGIQSLVQQSRIDGWSLLTYRQSPDDGPDLPPELDIDEVREAGVGGTGNALLWALSYGPSLTGRWIAFEHENADITNWNRYLLLKFLDAVQERAKAEIASKAFEKMHPGLKFGVMPDRVESFYHEFQRARTVLATVDDPKVRVELQPYSRNVLLNVGTNSQLLSVSVHEAEKIIAGSACVGCLYGQNQQAERRYRESTVSFVLALVGAALSGEFIKSYAFQEHLLADSWGPADIFYPASAKTVQAFKDPRCTVCGLVEKAMHEGASVKKVAIRSRNETSYPEAGIGPK